MEIKLVKYNQLLEDNKIIGVMGSNYASILKNIGVVNTKNVLFDNMYLNSLKYNYVAYIEEVPTFYTNYVKDEILLNINKSNVEIRSIDSRIVKLIRTMELDDNFLDKKISDLNLIEKRLLSYINGLIFNPNVIVVDEPYTNLDYNKKKIIKKLFLDLKRKYKKTIIIGSKNSNTIFELSNKVLFINTKECIYNSPFDIFKEEYVNRFNIKYPDLIKFSDIANNKGIKLDYYKDVRDLIKDVYKNVQG